MYWPCFVRNAPEDGFRRSQNAQDILLSSYVYVKVKCYFRNPTCKKCENRCAFGRLKPGRSRSGQECPLSTSRCQVSLNLAAGLSTRSPDSADHSLRDDLLRSDDRVWRVGPHSLQDFAGHDTIIRPCAVFNACGQLRLAIRRSWDPLSCLESIDLTEGTAEVVELADTPS